MADVKSKDKEISDEKESLQSSLYVSLLSKKELEKNALGLTDEAVSTFGIYFERAKERFIFLYSNLDFRPWNLSKSFVMVDWWMRRQ